MNEAIQETKEVKKLKLKARLIEVIKEMDSNLKLFCSEVRKDLRNEYDYVIGITGYPGYGKSTLAGIIGILIDYDYEFFKNICFIPTSKEIENSYMKLPMYSVLHVDEASRGLHKQKWYDKVQQKLNELYDTEREGHYLCTLLLMPRFQNFTENFRNFRIKYWINIVDRGLAIVYKRDEDKDAKDPWHIDENFKLKNKKWRGKRIYERDVPSVVRMEQQTLNYWFYFKFPEIPEDVWKEYQELKADSRKVSKENSVELENYKDRLQREKMERWKKISKLKQEGKKHEEIAVLLGCSPETIRRNLRQIEAWQRMQEDKKNPQHNSTKTDNIIYNPIKMDKFNSS